MLWFKKKKKKGPPGPTGSIFKNQLTNFFPGLILLLEVFKPISRLTYACFSQEFRRGLMSVNWCLYDCKSDWIMNNASIR